MIRVTAHALERYPHITTHAIERYQQRVEALSDEEVRERLSSPVIMRAVEFGHCAVRLPTGHRVIVVDHRVVTVHPRPKPAKVRNCHAGMTDR